MKLPGPTQTVIPDRRRRSLPSERLAHTRGIRQAIAAGLQLDPKARQAGYLDGLQGHWRLSVDDIVAGDRIDVLAYASGWLEGQRFRKNPIGG
jgi:hypothetical protein